MNYMATVYQQDFRVWLPIGGEISTPAATGVKLEAAH